MNFSVPDSLLGRQRCRQWTPLMTQQMRLRHVTQVMAYNLVSSYNGSFYYTLHLTTMCAPFYTSKQVDNANPKWEELDLQNVLHPSASAFVLRIWQARVNEMDVVINAWGICLSGLVYLGNKLSEIQPESFCENSVILQLHGCYFTSRDVLKTDLPKPLPFIDNLNIMSTADTTKLYRNIIISCTKNEVKTSYKTEKLQKLHFLQITIKNQDLDVVHLREKLSVKCGLYDFDSTDVDLAAAKNMTPVNRHTSQLLTMTTLNKMLHSQDKPTKLQRQQIAKINKKIEIARFRTKLLSHERDKKSAQIRQLKQKCTTLTEENEEKDSELMENYRKLSRDSDKLKEWKRSQIQHKELLLHTNAQLQHRTRQLMSQLLLIYPIKQLSESKYIVNGIYLPDSETLLDCSESGLAVALGYVSHIVMTCATFLQVPLRYPISFLGSRSHITDHITATLAEKDRDFPLYTKGKDKMQFHYAVYLLNKNIAQLRWLCGQHTPDLRTTLPNLLALLQGKESRRESRPSSANKLERSAAMGSQTLTERSDFLGDQLVNVPNDFHSSNRSLDKTNQYSASTMSLGSSANVERNFSYPFYTSSTTVVDPVLDTLRQESKLDKTNSPTCKNKSSEKRRGLSEILAIPEAFMNQQISSQTFKSFMASEQYKLSSSSTDGHDTESSVKTSHSEVGDSKPIENTKDSSNKPNCDNGIIIKQASTSKAAISSAGDFESIEQGTDILHSSLNYVPSESVEAATNVTDKQIKQKRRISRSVGSFAEEDNNLEVHCSLELGSDPLINVSSESNKRFVHPAKIEGFPDTLEDGQQEFLQKWLDSGPTLVYSEENLYPEEILGSAVGVSDTSSGLALRTDALLHTTSFKLMKPK